MSVDRVENQRKWGKVLLVTIILLGGSLVMTVGSMFIAEWLPLYFCWGDILFLSAAIVMLFNLMIGQPFPTGRWWDGAGWGLLSGVAAFALFAALPSNYSDPMDQMFNQACLGTFVALLAFGLGSVMGRYSLLFAAGGSFYLWITLFQDEVFALTFTIVAIGVAGVFLYWLNQTCPIEKEEPVNSDPFDIFKDPEFVKAVMEGKSDVQLSSDLDQAMEQLERMAEEQPNLTTNDDLPEWLIDPDEPQKEMFPEDTFQEDNILDKSSPALFAIFVVLLIGVLFLLTFIAVFIR